MSPREEEKLYTAEGRTEMIIRIDERMSALAENFKEHEQREREAGRDLSSKISSVEKESNRKHGEHYDAVDAIHEKIGKVSERVVKVATISGIVQALLVGGALALFRFLLTRS